MMKPNRAKLSSLSIFENQIVGRVKNAPRESGDSHRCKQMISISESQKPNETDRQPRFLSDLPELIKPTTAATLLGVSVKTIYDWRYRQKLRKIPVGFFVKVNRSLLIRTEIMRQWIASQNPSRREGE